MIRIITGKYKGRKLNQPPLNITRPTIDRIREGFFSSIQFKIENSIILDLFSGSGANAIEASSRGAMKIFAVENNKIACKIIQKNIEMLNIQNISLIESDVNKFIENKGGIKFDFIFMDPPYENIDLYNKTLSNILNKKLLKTQGLIICETNNPSKILLPEGFVIQKEKIYNNTYILAIANNI